MQGIKNNDILLRIESIFADDCEIPHQGLSVQTRLDEIKELDSFGIITLFMSIERIFGVRFTIEEIARAKTIGDIADGIRAKSNQ